MEEKKRTDEEKLLKQIRYFADRYGTSNCIGNPNKNFFTDVLDLIHRLQENNANQVRMRCDMQRKFDDLQTLCTEQKAENEQLKKDYIELDLECRELRTELDKELAEHEEFTQKAKAEIESLKCDSYRTSWKAKFLQAKKENERLTEERDIYLDDCSSVRHKLRQEIEEKFELQKQVDELLQEKGFLIARQNQGKKQAVKDTAKEILQELWDETEPNTKSHEWVRKRVKEIAKRKGVEVE